ncbi:MAG: hypothetical protein FWB72_06605 [Firmicutes bacterium]|nr:hypothetical protein [Bacillota bacterium]
MIGIDIEIDELVPCLTCRDTKKVVDTEFEYISVKGKLKGFGFNWHEIDTSEFKIKALKVKGCKEIQGLMAYKQETGAVLVELVESNKRNVEKKKGSYEGVGGHLFAEAVRLSFEAGKEGFVYFISKTNLIEYYKKTLGAELLVGNLQIMQIRDQNAQKLMEQYYGADE